MKKATKQRPSVGSRLVAAMTEVRDALATGEPLEKHFTIRTVEIPDPTPYNAKAVRRVRDRLGVSQAVFAKLVGVSVELIEHWEQGITFPRPIARRLLDEITLDPSAYLDRHLERRERRASA